jgi:hypothetical protein
VPGTARHASSLDVPQSLGPVCLRDEDHQFICPGNDRGPLSISVLLPQLVGMRSFADQGFRPFVVRLWILFHHLAALRIVVFLALLSPCSRITAGKKPVAKLSMDVPPRGGAAGYSPTI